MTYKDSKSQQGVTDQDLMDLAAFLDGEENDAVLQALETSESLRVVAAAGLGESTEALDDPAVQTLVERALPLARRTGLVGTGAPTFFERFSQWIGVDWRTAAAGMVLGIAGFGLGLSGGLGLGATGIETDDILAAASTSDLFAFDVSEETSLFGTDAFESVFTSIQ